MSHPWLIFISKDLYEIIGGHNLDLHAKLDITIIDITDLHYLAIAALLLKNYITLQKLNIHWSASLNSESTTATHPLYIPERPASGI